VRAAGIGLVLALAAASSKGPSRRLFDRVRAAVFPPRVTLQIQPGNVRIPEGTALPITARLVGAAAESSAQLEVGDSHGWHTLDMPTRPDGTFGVRVDAVNEPFKYRVLAGPVTSPTYSVAITTRRP
jgi:hypothetical protein